MKSRPGRPRGPKRNRSIHVMLSSEEFQALGRIEKTWKMKKCGVVRKLILDAAGK